MNNKYMDKVIDCFYDKVKSQWFSITSSGNAHHKEKYVLEP